MVHGQVHEEPRAQDLLHLHGRRHRCSSCSGSSLPECRGSPPYSSAFPASSSTVRRLFSAPPPPEQATKHACATANGILGRFGYASTAISGVTFGYLAEHFGWDSVFLVSVIIGLVGAAVVAFMWKAPADGYAKAEKVMAESPRRRNNNQSMRTAFDGIHEAFTSHDGSIFSLERCRRRCFCPQLEHYHMFMILLTVHLTWPCP